MANNKKSNFIRLPKENLKETNRLLGLLEKRLRGIQGEAEIILIKALKKQLGISKD